MGQGKPQSQTKRHRQIAYCIRYRHFPAVKRDANEHRESKFGRIHSYYFRTNEGLLKKSRSLVCSHVALQIVVSFPPLTDR